MTIGGLEWVLIILTVLLLFGGKHIPGLVRNIGRGVKELRKVSDGIRDGFERGKQEMANTVKYESEEKKEADN